MRTLSLAAVALAAASTAVGAADLPRRGRVESYAPLPPTFTWTGPYLGFNLGAAFSVGEKVGVAAVNPGTFGPGAPALPTTIIYGKRDRGGFTGGVQGGYNYQFSAESGPVIGLEADLQYAALSTDRPPTIVATPAFVPSAAITLLDPRGTRGVDWFGTVRGRAGWAFDRLLVYGTGGLAYGEGGRGACFGSFGCGDNLRVGWAAGGGVEYAIPTESFLYMRGGALTLRAEALYVSLAHGRNAGLYAYNGVTGAAYYTPLSRDGDDFAVARVGLSYKFGTGW